MEICTKIFLSCLLTFNLYSESIFNGKDLEGWSGDTNIWKVEEGAITAKIDKGKKLAKNQFLFYKENLNDFELTLDYRILSGKTNSGIQFRSVKGKSGNAVGYQADLDDGTTWLGRIYDEHGRGLILERGTLTTISKTGERVSLPFRNKDEYKSIPRKNDWNNYKVLARGHRIEIYINGIHFSTLEDYQNGETDLEGYIALQLHSGVGPAKIQFKNIVLKKLKMPAKVELKMPAKVEGIKRILPLEMPNIGFEEGDLSGWTATGAAFTNQPAKAGSIVRRGREKSNASGSFFVGTFEIDLSDKAEGTLTSKPFKVTHNWATLKVGGGADLKTTRVEIVEEGTQKIIYQFCGSNYETMSTKVANLTKYLDKSIFIRIIDNNSGSWGHINYDDFQFHSIKPTFSAMTSKSPILRHLVKNKVTNLTPKSIVNSMHVPKGFKVEEVISPEVLKQPIAFTFDSKGRIWVAEAYAYPRRQKAGKGQDRLVIFEDKDGDGSYETRKIFADNLNLVSGFEIGYGGVFVGAAPELLFIPDRDGDDKPDGKYEVLLNGWDIRDTHETPNSFMWGHDGWLYGNHGVYNSSWVGKPGTPKKQRVLVNAAVWRFHPVSRAFEIYAKGGSNQWGLDYNADGAMFMTHCRSYWGRGPVSQVIRDGHYWNQNNARHSDFILTPGGRRNSSQKINFNNSLFSAAAYGHGKGGAGDGPSRTIFGGHSHVGAMVYLGNNWPEEYKNQLYTHNLHGAQMNREFVQRYDSAYLTHSYGRDQLKVNNKQYLAVDLKYGPDGAVYSIDWIEKQHCHTNNRNAWDRSNGAVYRMQWTKTYKPLRIKDLATLSNGELVKLLNSSNEWFSRMSQHTLRQRAVSSKIGQSAKDAIAEKLFDVNNKHRFRALVALYGVGGINKEMYLKLLADKDDIIRSQAVHFITEKALDFTRNFNRTFIKMAQEDQSAMVRLQLAGACQKRLDDKTALRIIKILSKKVEDSQDRFIPKMLWYAYSKFAANDLASSLKLANQSPMRVFRNSAYWYTMKRDKKLFFTEVEKVKSNEHFADYMAILAQIKNIRNKEKPPVNWPSIYKRANVVVNDKGVIRVLSGVYGKAKIVIDELQEKITRGKNEFALCAACHNPGKSLPGPSLEEIASTYSTKEEIIKWIKKPGKIRPNYPQMPPFDKLKPESLDAIATYLLSIRPVGLTK